MEEIYCRIEATLGRQERCPGSACPFWSTGVEERQGHCSLEDVDFAGRTDLAQWLHELRESLAGADPDTPAARNRFFGRLNAGHGD